MHYEGSGINWQIKFVWFLLLFLFYQSDKDCFRPSPVTGRSKKKEHCSNEKLYPLEETEACPCDEFLSQPYGNWSACVLSDPSVPGSLQGWMSQREVKECGQGLRYRAVACVDQQGHLVSPTLCTDSGRIHRNKNFSFLNVPVLTNLPHTMLLA